MAVRMRSEVTYPTQSKGAADSWNRLVDGAGIRFGVFGSEIRFVSGTMPSRLGVLVSAESGASDEPRFPSTTVNITGKPNRADRPEVALCRHAAAPGGQSSRSCPKFRHPGSEVLIHPKAWSFCGVIGKVLLIHEKTAEVGDVRFPQQTDSRWT